VPFHRALASSAAYGTHGYVVRIPSADVIVIGYGSLMSGLGLLPATRLRVRAAARVALLNARRGFGKLSQDGNRFAMVLEPVNAALPIEAHGLAADEPPSTAPEGIALLVQPTDLTRLSDREGYSGGAVQRLRQEASARGQDLAAFLWSTLEAAEFNVGAFRQRLFGLVGYTSPHYVPHPVRLDTHRFALTFLAPGREGSGSERVVPVRVSTRSEMLLTAPEAWHRKPTRAQLTYFVACLLGGVHGISVQDLVMPLADTEALCARVRTALAAEHKQELSRFLEMTGLDHGAYWDGFGPPTQSLRRSGLEQLLKNPPAVRPRSEAAS
jgi:hypothetical protein